MRDFGDINPAVYLLSRLGTASGLRDGVSVALSGQWSQEPAVAVGLSDMVTYDPSKNATIYLESGVEKTEYAGNGVYKVRAYATAATSGGQSTWGVNERIPASGFYSWDYNSPASPPITYTFGWFGTMPNIKTIIFSLEIQSARKDAREWYGCGSIANIYVDYIDQASGTMKSLGVRTVTFSLNSHPLVNEIYQLYNIKATLNSLASNVRVRVVISNSAESFGGMNWGLGGYNANEYVRFLGGVVQKDPAAGSVTTYSGNVFALAVGR
ncbi:hypothetical protein [Cloacibacillus evryensis]|uniref:hypothetical protein n=1 Tax=Cloacibacillus evryensis TaxID=508460 RepID=UPI00044843E5|nr:hypothetical protein [Cloacibacillus evryensis]EXG78369.1 hypothetical protein Cloev_0487 [Cloacibacillus evryensis DSM 19522]MEA5034850.1 hypothetical protein [Cloacibacillus evryensis]